jgi:hypothetical protein
LIAIAQGVYWSRGLFDHFFQAGTADDKNQHAVAW